MAKKKKQLFEQLRQGTGSALGGLPKWDAPAGTGSRTTQPAPQAQPLTSVPNNSAPLQTLELTEPTQREKDLAEAQALSKAARFDLTHGKSTVTGTPSANKRTMGQRHGFVQTNPDKLLGDDEVADYIRQRDQAAKNLQGLSFGDVLKDPMYAAGTLLENLDYGITDVGRRIFNPSKAKEIDERTNAYNEATGYKPGAVEATVNRGAANFNASVGDTLDFLVGENLKRLGWKDNPVSGFADALRSDQAVNEGNYQRARQDQSKAGRVAMDVGAGAVEALPDMVLLLLSGGTSAGAEGAGALTRGGTRLAGREAAAASAGRLAAAQQTARAVAADTARNPMFWTSFTRTAGPSYYYAKSQGADDYHASMYALLNATANSVVEIGGGVQKLPGELQKGGSAAWAWFKSNIEEGNEEVIQGFIERGLQNLVYGADNPLASTTDSNAIFNPKTALEEFGMGAAVAGVLGAPSAVNQGISNIRNGRQTAPQAQERPAPVTVQATEAPKVQTPAAAPAQEAVSGSGPVINNPKAVTPITGEEAARNAEIQEIAGLIDQIARQRSAQEAQAQQAAPVQQENGQKREATQETAQSAFTGDSGTRYTQQQADALSRLTNDALVNFAESSFPLPLNQLGLDAETQQALREAGLTYVNEDSDTPYETLHDHVVFDERSRRRRESRTAAKAENTQTALTRNETLQSDDPWENILNMYLGDENAPVSETPQVIPKNTGTLTQDEADAKARAMMEAIGMPVPSWMQDGAENAAESPVTNAAPQAGNLPGTTETALTQSETGQNGEEERIATPQAARNDGVEQNFTPEDHIDNRTDDYIAKRSTKPFQHEHPELHDNFVAVAKDMQELLYASVESDMPGRKGGTNAWYPDAIRKLLQATGESRPKLIQVLQDIIDNHGAEDYATAKRVEKVLDELLTNGYDAYDPSGRRHVQPDSNYLAKKDAIDGAQDRNSLKKYIEENYLRTLEGDTEEDLKNEWEALQIKAQMEQMLGRPLTEADLDSITNPELFDKLGLALKVEAENAGLQPQTDANGLPEGHGPMSPAFPYREALQQGQTAEAEQQSATPAENINGGITVYRGYNRSDNPLENNLAQTLDIYDVLGTGSPRKDVEKIPLSYYTESAEDAGRYAGMDQSLYDSLVERAKFDYNGLLMRGTEPPEGRDAWIQRRAAESYKALTGRSAPGKGEVRSHTIYPKKTLDLTGLGEKATPDDVYRTISEQTGVDDRTLDSKLILSNISEGEPFDVFRILRNAPGVNTGSAMLSILRDNGFDSVRYSESGTNHYAMIENPAMEQSGAVERNNEANANGTQAEPSPSEPTAAELKARMEEMLGRPLTNADLDSMANQELADRIRPAMEQSVPTDANGLPEGQGAMSTAFPYREAPTQTHGSDSLYNEDEREIEGLRPEDSTHKVNTDAEVDRNVQERLELDYDGEKADLFDNKPSWDDADTAAAHRIMEAEIAQARLTGDYSEVIRLQRVWEAHGTMQGQALRQRGRFAHTAADIVGEAATTLDGQDGAQETIDEIAGLADEWEQARARGEDGVQDMIDLILRLNARRRTGGFFNGRRASRTLQNALNAVTEQDGGLEFLTDIAESQIRNLSADHARLSPMEAIKSVRYLAMLSKLNTTMRNLVGNTAFDITETVSNNVATPLDMLLSLRTGRRTTALDASWFSEAKRKGAKEAAIRAYIETALDADLGDTSNRFEQRTGRTFKMDSNFAERFLSSMEKWQRYMLTVTDEFAKGGTRAEQQRGIDRLTQRGRLEEGALDNWAEETALQRTFQNDGRISSALQHLRNAGNVLSIRDGRGGSFGLGDAILPFAQVPGNVAGQFFNYSPLGLVKGAHEVFSVLRAGENATAEQQARAVRDVGRGLNGTAFVALFTAMAANGLLKVAGDDDKDKAALERDEGVSGTQLNLDAVLRWLRGEDTAWQDGDTLMSIGFLEPFNGDMAMGYMLSEAYKDAAADGDVSAGEIAGGIVNANAEASLQAVMDLPAMSTLKNIADAYEYSDADTTAGKMADAGVQFFGDTMASFVPNAVAGIAQGMDDGRTRVTRTSDRPGAEGALENAVNVFKSKIPGLRETLPQALDSWGQGRQTTASPLQNWFNANILPGAITQYDTNEVNQELYRLGETQDVDLPARNPAREVQAGDEKKQLSTDEQRAYQQNAGQTSFRELQELMNTPQYQTMTDAERATAFNAILGYGKAKGEQAVGGSKETPDWAERGDASVAENAGFFGILQAARQQLDKDDRSKAGPQMGAILDRGLSEEDTLGVFRHILTGSSESTMEKIENADDPLAWARNYVGVQEARQTLPEDQQDRNAAQMQAILDSGVSDRQAMEQFKIVLGDSSTVGKVETLYQNGYPLEQIVGYYNASSEKVVWDDEKGTYRARHKDEKIQWLMETYGYTKAQATYVYKVFQG